MKPYLLSLGAGLAVGILYSLMQVRSPAPPVIALLGLLGMLVGEQALPAARWLVQRGEAEALLPNAARHIFGEMPSIHRPQTRRDTEIG
ncbi:DUF1427 family protein [Poseidonocella sp. HB161398]|uniref:DUF1427 family protein n=1 Tax=Poseidonocella sp. HB161398 TaxID=2320855 RepID=UPI001108ED74|nr:DUF1427 family protein [Poseidonocella sp. HB161398]